MHIKYTPIAVFLSHTFASKKSLNSWLCQLPTCKTGTDFPYARTSYLTVSPAPATPAPARQQHASGVNLKGEKMERNKSKLEVRIRNVDPRIVARLDEMASAQRKTLSAFLRPYLTRISTQDEVLETDEKYRNLVLAVVEAVEENTTTLKQLIQEIQEGNIE